MRLKKRSAPKKALSLRRAVVDGTARGAGPTSADHHELHAALGDHHVRLAPDERARIDEFEAALAHASAARTYQDAAPRWANVAQRFPPALKEAAELIDRGLLTGVTLSPRMRALCNPVGASSDEVLVAAVETIPTVTLEVFRPDLDRAQWEWSIQGVFVMPMKASRFMMPVTARSWRQGLGILSFAICQFAGCSVPEALANYLARLREALASNVDENGCGGSAEDKARAEELVRDYPEVLREMQAHIERLKAVEESEEGRAVRDAFARKVAAWRGAPGADEPTVNKLPERDAPAREPPSAPASAPTTTSPIALPPSFSAKVHGTSLTIIVDPEIVALIPRQSEGELALLEQSLVREGCRDPVVVWVDGRRRVLLDGHTRVFFCRKNNLRYNIRELMFSTRAEAITWVLAAQLARRNLGPEWHSYLRGRYYNALKAQGARHDLTSGKTSQKLTTAQRIAREHKVDEKTVRSDGRFAEQLDQLAHVAGKDVKAIVLARQARVSRADIARLVGLDREVQRRVVDDIRNGSKAAAALHARGVTKVRPTPKPSRATPGAPSLPAETMFHTANVLDFLVRSLEDSVAFLESANVGAVDEATLSALYERVAALDAQLVRHGLAWQKEG